MAGAPAALPLSVPALPPMPSAIPSAALRNPPLTPPVPPLPAMLPAAAPRRLPRWLRGIITAVVVTTGVLFTFTALGQQGTPALPAATALLLLLTLLLSLTLSVLLVWRDRWPYLVPVFGSLLVFLLPVSALLPVLGLASLLHRRRGYRVWLAAILVAAAQVVGTVRDIGAPLSFLRSISGGATAEPSPGALIFGTCVPLLVAVAYGLVRRSDGDRRTAVNTTQSTLERSQVLYEEVSRQHERDELAREIHDTLAARLSVISLNAGALGLSLGDGTSPQHEASARIQSAAQSAVADLRGVIGVLRDGEGTAIRGTESLAQLSTLIEEAHSSAEPVQSAILVSDLESCDAEVSHVCYRLVQEALSNARRHAPGQGVRVSLRGGPTTGLSLDVTNRIVPTPATPSAASGGWGLTGMAERAQALGGWFQTDRTEAGDHRIRAWLPWHPAGSSAPLD